MLKTLNDSNNKVPHDISSNGIDENKLKNMKLVKVKEILQCHFCAKYFNNDMIVKSILLGELEEQLCKHCYFLFNYDENNRLKFDTESSKVGHSITSYILSCYKEHDSDKCSVKDAGCFLCDYNLKKPIKNILNPELLLPKVGNALENNFADNTLTNNHSNLSKIITKNLHSHADNTPQVKEQVKDQEKDQETCDLVNWYGLNMTKKIRIPKKITL